MKIITLISVIILLFVSCKKERAQEGVQSGDTAKIILNTETKFLPKKEQQIRVIKKAIITPSLDGNSDDPAWKEQEWYAIDQRWIGPEYTATDFSGRYKLTWTPEAIYLLAEIQDDILYDKEKDPLTLWWDDDCLEIFIDADNSGGEHQFTHNAFAYHVALDGNVVDLAPGEIPTLYNSHIRSERKTTGNTTIWECEILVYDDSYIDGGINDQQVLNVQQKIGFALAYCDNDSSAERENFIGSVFVPGEDKNRGWIDAGIFGTLELIE